MNTHAQTSEKAIEKFFCQRMRQIGLPCIKQYNPYEAGWPDRLVLLPHMRCQWVEFKSTGKKPTPLQQQRHDTLRKLGHSIDVVSTRQEAEDLAENIREYLIIERIKPRL